MIAASRSKVGFTGVGFLSPSSDQTILRNNLLKAGAEHIISCFKELIDIIKSEE